MCYDRGLSAIYLEESDKIAQVEFIAHTTFISRISGLDPLKHPNEALKRTYDRLDLDMIWFTYDPLDPWSLTKMRGERFAVRADSWSKAFPTTWRETCSVSSVEEVLEFNPFEAWDVPSVDELAEHFERVHSSTQSFYENQLVPGGTYLTCFMWLVMIFGLKWTIKAAYHDPKRFKRLLDRFGQLSLLQIKAWSRTSIKAFVSHDDICSTQGPFFSPRWMREYLFPWYERLWHELRSRGIVVLFCSDGNITPIMGDIARAGADGFIIEECCDLNYIAEKYGNDKVIIGGVDVGVLTYGSAEDVVNEVKRCVRVAGPYPGYFINVSGSIPDNIPLRNLETYFEACRKYRLRMRAVAPLEVR
uniref:Uroporphyrinogen decarboxylase (URO-D) domain-containing protein n=1 Tax=Thermofilum pendens TaxID=2269 RepID=A0A7C4BB82_THEPE